MFLAQALEGLHWKRSADSEARCGVAHVAAVVTAWSKLLTVPTRVEQHQPLGILHRELLQQHGIHNAEQRGVCADAERERQNRDDRERRMLNQHLRGITEIS